MKKMILLAFLVGLTSCDDGDLQIEQVDFDEANIETCTDVEDATQTTFFFKIDSDEALLLDLAEGLIMNQTSTPGTIASTIPAPSNLIYRLFSDNVTQAYFCDAIPPLEPMVINENTATSGDILIDTRVDTLTTTTKNYAHTISITNLSLVNDQGEQLTDLSTLNYGTFVTRPDNSIQLDAGPFSNYSGTEMRRCGAFSVDSILRIYNTINDEFIALDVPEEENLFENAVTLDTMRTLDLSENDVFKYVVLDTLIDNQLACEQTLADPIRSWSFASTAGTLAVRTTAAEPDAAGAIEYTHTITLENLILTARFGGNAVNDLAPIALVELGTYITTVE